MWFTLAEHVHVQKWVQSLKKLRVAGKQWWFKLRYDCIIQALISKHHFQCVGCNSDVVSCSEGDFENGNRQGKWKGKRVLPRIGVNAHIAYVCESDYFTSNLTRGWKALPSSKFLACFTFHYLWYGYGRLWCTCNHTQQWWDQGM